MTRPDVSIVLPVWNHLYDLTIPWVEKMRQTKGEWELIIVDNGSKDGTTTWLKDISREDKRIKPVFLPENTGFGGGNNAGFKKARASVVCFISNDVLIGSDNWTWLMLKAVQENPNALMGPQYIDFNQLTVFDFETTPYLAGWCVFASKNVFKRIAKDGQVWDEDFGAAYFEDVWLSVRARDEGFDVKEIPLNLEHIGSQSSDQINIPEMTEKNSAIFTNKMMVRKLDQAQTKRIVFFAPGVPYPFLPEDVEGKGVGGAESSLVALAKELADKGYRVEVYNRTERVGKFDGVFYRSISEFIPSDYCDVFILFRSWHPALEVVNAELKWFWSCDQYTDVDGVWDMKVFSETDLTICISPYHETYLKANYKNINRTKVIDLGIRWDDYKKLPMRKRRDRAIFCSIPTRGLDMLAQAIPLIREKMPEFNVVITSDFRLWGQAHANNEEYKSLFYEMEGVKFLGKIDRKELVKHQLKAQIMAYPSNYPECFCISAMECMAAGAVPVTSDMGALPTTVGEGGVVLSNGNLLNDFVDSIVELLEDYSKLTKYRQAGRNIAQKHDWKVIVDEWVELIEKEEPMPKAKKAKKGAVEKKTMTAPEVSLPKYVMLRFTEPVEFAINGKAFTTKVTTHNHKTVYQVEVPYELMPTAMQIVRDAYGDIVA